MSHELKSNWVIFEKWSDQNLTVCWSLEAAEVFLALVYYEGDCLDSCCFKKLHVGKQISDIAQANVLQ